MNESEIKAIEALRDLSIVDEDDPAAEPVMNNSAALSIAEAEDMLRLHDLLHRDEYRPLIAIRHQREEGKGICVYFVRLDNTV